MRFQTEIDNWKKLGFFNQYNISKEQAMSLPTRYSVRSVILLEDARVVLVKVAAGNYHSITGGGIEEGEEIKDGMIRESAEESGYDVSIIRELGYIEYWKKNKKKYDFAYLVKAIGEPKALLLTEEEISLGHEIVIYSMDEAIQLLDNEVINLKNPVSERSLVFLREAKKYLENVVK